ncbi:hypothetical protein CLU96_2461 [Chryseobacterium sp. 52]|uniref:hypothetical protein n=1 Tax=Chryseobacterium sp. 52 TaxID=2035213 RepID=UPI000C3DEF7F|nr:hypothetical protein [Chryseobacterium sp. 52]PIF45456.1 hypothetical protein CLU96_2461 [Chryseobacterium sp. 52]
MKKNITSLFFCMSLGMVSAQTSGNKQSTLPNIIPPSSESYKLGAYGNVPVSLFTGNANVDIPLTSYQTKNIKIPIRLGYFSSGIKVDDMNGSTGLGWNLTSGGVITRIIRDLPDEDHQTNITIPTNIDALGVRNPVVMQFFQDASHDDVDSEQDLYMASFNGMQIKFVFDKRGVPVIYSQKDVIIEGTSGGNSFTITVDDGTKYYFTDKETTSNRTSGAGHSLISISTTAWYLTKIEDISSGETVFIENTEGGYSTTISQSQTLSYTAPGDPMTSGCGNPAFIRYPEVSPTISHNQTVNGRQIKRIYSSNPLYGEIIFDYLQSGGNTDYKRLQKITKKVNNILINDISLNYTLTGYDRLFLDSVRDNVLNTTHNFEYNQPQQLVGRLSYAKDIWGYYNGEVGNTTLIPMIAKLAAVSSYPYAATQVNEEKTQIGILKKIIYPTKGSTDFLYENNTAVYKNVLLSPVEWNGVQIKAENWDSDLTPFHTTNSTTFSSIRDEEIPLGGGAAFNGSKCSQDLQVPGKHRANVTLKRPNGQPVLFYTKSPSGVHTNVGYSFTFPINGDSFYAHIQKNEILTLSITTLFECVRSQVGARYTTREAVYGDKEGPIGGLRISKITDNTENGVATTRKFVYHDTNEQTTEAIVLRTPAFEEELSFTRACNSSVTPGNPGGGTSMGVERFPYYTVTSTNINQLFASHPNVFYKAVQEIVEGKSTVIHKYSTSSDDFGKVLYGSNIRSSQWTNFGWNNGREILTKYVDGSNNLVRTVEMNYEEDQNRKYQVDSYAIRKNYDNPLAQNVSRVCTAEDITRTIDFTYCTANHTHRYITTDLYKNCYALGANNVTQTYKDVCYGQIAGSTVAFDDYLDNLDIMQYKNISHFEYLKSQKTTDYLAGNAMKTETQYFYNNPKHTQLSLQKTVYPDLSYNEITYQYAHEKNNQLMMNRNMVGIPLETMTTHTEGNTPKMLSKTETIYPTSLPNTVTGNLVLPVAEKTYDILNTTVPSTDVTYDRYDEKGNVLQYTTKDGVPVSILWGYNQTRPIAKVEGILYSQIENTLPWMSGASDSDAADSSQESSLLDTYERFRKMGIFADKMVTTYTYDPLIGVTSITPPSGIREVYIYDTANRLKEIRENSATGKILKEFQYNYKQ